MSVELELSQTSTICIFGRKRLGKTTLAKTLQRAYPRVVIIDPAKDYKTERHICRDLRSFGQFLIRNQHASHFRVVLQFDFQDKQYAELTDEAFILTYKLGNCLLVVDEAQLFLHSHYLKNLILIGGHQNIALMLSTQRPANISKDAISQASDIFIGTLHEKNDLDYLSTMLNPDDLELLPRIKKYHFLHYRAGEPSRVIPNR